MTPQKSYTYAYERDDEEYSTIVLPRKDKYIMSHVDKLDMDVESCDDYFRSSYKGIKTRKGKKKL